MISTEKDKVSVAIITDKNFPADKLIQLCTQMHVWLIDSPENERSRHLWGLAQVNPDACGVGSGLTCFQEPKPEASPKESLLWILDEVDVHHGEYSHPPGWDQALVFGAAPSDMVKEAFEELGFYEHSSDSEGRTVFSR